ncbi:MAG TPA: ABC transporter ATP-binding protein [Candidatus Limnocylindrales bacterium]
MSDPGSLAPSLAPIVSRPAPRSAPGQAAIETRDLAKAYGATVALAGLTMTVRRGEVFGFLGPNGAGKTTAVKLLVGLTRPTGGSGTVLGAPLGDLDVRRRLGYLPELFRYQPWMTAAEVLGVHDELARVPRVGRAARVASALELVGLADRRDDRVATFSKGMQQRLGLAVALLGEPELVLLDEPTSALDPVGRLDVRRIIAGLRERGVTVFLNSHLLTEVERVCDRVAIVDRGRVVAELGMAELLGDRSVRVRVDGLAEADAEALSRFGTATWDGPGWLRVHAFAGPDDEIVPALVAELVARGGRVHAVLPGHRSLEERFLDLLGGSGETAASPSSAGPGSPP